MYHKYVPLSEVVANVRVELKKQFPDVKFRVYKGASGNSFTVAIVSAPFDIYRDGREYHDQIQVYHYTSYAACEYTTKGNALVKGVDAIIGEWHWDESDIQTDYFNCSFYYSINVGSAWNKPFVKSVKKGGK